MSVIHVIWSISWALSNFNNSIDMLGLSYIHCITTLFLSSGWFITMSAIFYRCTHAITWTRNIYFPDINQFCIKLYYALYKLWPFQLCEFKIILTKFRNIRNLQPVSNYNFVNSKYTFMVKKAVSWNIKKIKKKLNVYICCYGNLPPSVTFPCRNLPWYINLSMLLPGNCSSDHSIQYKFKHVKTIC